jgi:hypothetical protein
MRPTFRKLEVKDIGNLERLVADNIDGVEPGLKVVDSRLLLGQAAIDLVGLDSKDSLVLIALDFSADDGLLLRVMDAYSWCLEYPDTLRRLYPMAQATSRPPRILFVVEKMTDAFLRRVKQLSFLEIDCFEFRYLEVNGASVVYFDLVERLRKSVVDGPSEVAAPAAARPDPVVPSPVVPRVEHRVELRVEPRIEPRVESPVEPAKPALAWATRVESREPVSEPRRVEPVKAVVAEPIRLEPTAVVAAAPEPVAPVVAVSSAPEPVEPEPSVVAEVKVEAAIVPPTPVIVMAAPEPIVVAPEPIVVAPEPIVVAPEPIVTMPVEPALALEAIETTSTRADTNGHVAEPDVVVAPVTETAPRVTAPVEEGIAAAPAAPVPAAPEAAPAPVVRVEPAPAPVPPTPVWAKPGAQANGTKPHFFAHATKSASPVEAPAMVAVVAATAEPASPPAASKVGLEVDDRPELESLSFPKDGLSRQWLEFLSQLGATK